MAVAIVFQAMALLAVALKLFSTLTRSCELGQLLQLAMVCSHVVILAAHACTIFRTQFPSFIAVAVFLLAVRLFTMAPL